MIGVHNNRKAIEAFIRANLKNAPDDACQIWTGRTTKTGFGTIHIGGAAFAVRRVVWWMKHGYLPQGSCMSDHCGNPACCNVNHLEDRTPEHQRRKTLFKSSEFNSPLLSEKEIARVWEDRVINGTKWKELAATYRVSTKTLRKQIRQFESGL
jgi:hypothetical protein